MRYKIVVHDLYTSLFLLDCVIIISSVPYVIPNVLKVNCFLDPIGPKDFNIRSCKYQSIYVYTWDLIL